MAAWKGLNTERKRQFKSRYANDKAVANACITKLSLPTKVLDQLLLWKAEPGTFLEISRKSQPAQTHIFVQVYVLLYSLDNDYIANQIRRRILLLILYRVKAKIASGSRLASVKWPQFLDLVLQSGLSGGNKDAIEEKLSKWTSGGARYSTFADELNGIGSIVLLPFHISPHR